ncbi:MAG: dynamin family protein [Actinobacteria bacterium]|nr:dynamin family protein [Actinomycetota bacterium]
MEVPEPTPDAQAVVDLGLKAAAAYGRDDLARRLDVARERLGHPEVRLLVVGEFKQGKSSLVNALAGHDVCPVDDDIATSVPTYVRFAPEASARVVFEPEGDDGGVREPEHVDLDRLGAIVAGTSDGDGAPVARVEVGLPGDLLRTGLVLVDTPGVGGLGSKHGAITVGVLPTADAVMLVSDASQEYSKPEVDFLEQARAMCPNLISVLTKTDLYPEWRKVADLDRGHLAAHGFDVEVLPASAELYALALADDDPEDTQFSGIPALTGHLQRELVARSQRLSARAAASDVIAVADHLEAAFASERVALTDPEQAEELVNRLTAARDQAEALRGQAAGWQQTLSDGVADLNADVDHDFRARMRDVLRDAEVALNECDPGEVWDEFTTWLEQRMSSEVVETYSALTRRTEELAGRVAEHFAEVEADVSLRLEVASPMHVLEALTSHQIEMAREGIGSGVMNALRGSYGGVLMFSAISRMVGLAALGPVVGVIGLLMGRKAMRDEKDRQVARRRQDGMTAARRYVDDVSFVVGKEVRDSLRLTQRELRQLFSDRAGELHRSAAEALQAAQRSLALVDAGREDRIEAIDLELRRIRGLRERARALAPDLDRRAADAGAGS